MQAEHAATEIFGGAVFDNTDRRIAVFDRCREIALLKRAAHPPPFALRHLATKDQAFGAPADRTREGPDQHFAGLRRAQLLRPDFAPARRRHPKRPRSRIGINPIPEGSDGRLLAHWSRQGTIARYTEAAQMSIRIPAPPRSPPALVREARSVFARSLGFAAAAIPVPVFGGAVGPLPALVGLALFTGLLVRARARARGAPSSSPPRGSEPDHSPPRGDRLSDCRAGARAGPARGSRTVAAHRHRRGRSVARRRRWVGGAPPAIGLRLRRALRHGGRRVRHSRSCDNGSEGAGGPWLGAGIGAMRYLYLARRWCAAAAAATAVSPIADRRRKTIAVIQSVALLIALVPATPRWLGGGHLRHGARASRLFICRRHRLLLFTRPHR